MLPAYVAGWSRGLKSLSCWVSRDSSPVSLVSSYRSRRWILSATFLSSSWELRKLALSTYRISLTSARLSTCMSQSLSSCRAGISDWVSHTLTAIWIVCMFSVALILENGDAAPAADPPPPPAPAGWSRVYSVQNAATLMKW